MVHATVNPQAKLVINKPNPIISKAGQSGSGTFRSHRGPPVTLVANQQTEDPRRCEQFDGSHSLTICSDFKNLSTDDRYAVLSKFRLCMVCFSNNHWANKCKCSCSILHGRHHQLLHRDSSRAKPSKASSEASSTSYSIN